MVTFLFLIPLAGFVAGVICYCIRSLRLFAPFAFLCPGFASYGAFADLLIAAAEIQSPVSGWPGLASMFGGFLIGGLFGAGLGTLVAVGVLRFIRWLSRIAHSLRGAQ